LDGGHVGAEDGVHAGLVAGALGVEPGDDVGIEAQGEELLRRGDEDGILVGVGGDALPIGVGGDGGFEFGFRHGVQAAPIGAVFAAVTHGLDFWRRLGLDVGGVRHGGPAGGR
jgi:hypothetical protein